MLLYFTRDKKVTCFLKIATAVPKWIHSDKPWTKVKAVGFSQICEIPLSKCFHRFG